LKTLISFMSISFTDLNKIKQQYAIGMVNERNHMQ